MATGYARSYILEIHQQLNGSAKDLNAHGKELDEDQESSRTSWSWNSLNLQSTSSSSSVKWRRTTMSEFPRAQCQTVVGTGQRVAKLTDGVGGCFLFSSTSLTG